MNRHVIMHAGALGDFVMIWPMMRAIIAQGGECVIFAPASKARLARRVLGPRVIARDIEHPALAALWRGPDAVEAPVDAEARRAWSFVAAEGDAKWLAAAQRAFPAAVVSPVGPPGSASRAEAWRELNVAGAGGAPARPPRRERPLMIHLGAGSGSKRWPLARWRECVDLIGLPVRVVAGEVEREQWGADELAVFADLGGVFIDSLDALADEIDGSQLFIGCDTGPTHLAAQLGGPTVALFGLTDPRVWAPAGPCVRVLAPSTPSPMNWLLPRQLAEVVRELLKMNS